MLSTTRTRPHWHRFATRFSTLLSAATLAATVSCSAGGDPTGPNDQEDEEGQYSLARVDLAPPPVAVHRGPWYDAASGTFYNAYIVEVVNGEIRLLDDHRFTFSLAIAIDGDGQRAFTALQIGGWYEIDGDEILLTADGDGGELLAEIDDGEIEMELDVMGEGFLTQLIFRK